MMEPSLIIGLGTSGLIILEHIQEFLYTSYSNQIRQDLGRPIEFPQWVQDQRISLINFETDQGKIPRRTPGGTVITIHHTVVDSLERSWQRRKAVNQNVNWFDPEIGPYLQSHGIDGVHAGAGNYRAVGRWSEWENFSEIYSVLQHEYDRVIAGLPAPQPGAKIANIIVTGTLIGGTCSGMFLDFGYVSRQISLDHGRLIGFFLMPPSNLPKTFHRRYANTWAALEDMEAYTGRREVDAQQQAKIIPSVPYVYEWPNGMECFYRNLPPYAAIYLSSIEYAQQAFPPLRDYNVLCSLSGHVLFAYICGLRTAINAVAVDGNPGSIFGSFGFSGVSYPIYKFGEYTACGLAQGLINRMADENNWIDAEDNTIPIKEAQIFEEAAEFFDKEVQDVINHFLSLGQENLDSRIVKLARKWESGDTSVDSIWGEYRREPQNTANTSALIGGLKTEVESQLRKVLAAKIESTFQLTENIKYVETFLEGLDLHRQRLLRLWKDQGPDANREVLNKAINESPLRKIPPPPLGIERRLGNEAQIWRLADMNRLHNLAQILERLDFQGTTGQSQEFFTVGQLRTLRTTLIQPQQGIYDLIGGRREELKQLLTDPTLPVRSVWRRGSLVSDERDLQIDANCPRRFADLGMTESITAFFNGFIDLQPGRPIPWSRLVGGFHRRVDNLLGMPQFKFTMQQVADQEDLEIDARRAERVLLPLVVGSAMTGKTAGFYSGIAQADLPTIDAIYQKHATLKGRFPYPAKISECGYEILFYREERNLKPLDDLINKANYQHCRNKPQLDDQGVPIFSLKMWEALLDPYLTRSLKVQPLAEKVAEVIKNVVIQWQTDPASGNLVPAGSFLPELEVSRVADILRLRLGNGELSLPFTNHLDLQPSLTTTLLQRREFLEPVANLLRGWQVGQDLLQEMAPRWQAMGYPLQEVDRFAKEYSNLKTYLTFV